MVEISVSKIMLDFQEEHLIKNIILIGEDGAVRNIEVDNEETN